MEKTGKLITDSKCFLNSYTVSSISKYKECLDKFSQNFDKEVSLKTDTPIILDTNVLLRYYSISFIARTKLFRFLKDNKSRIYLTNQVQIEFLKNREDIIQRFFEQVTSKIPKDFSTDIVNKMKNFLDQYKVILKDYPFVEPGIEKYQSELESLLKQLNTAVDLKKKEHIDLIVNDKWLDLLSTFNQCEQLTEEEITIIKKHFDGLSKSVTSDSIDSILNKPNGAFPGLGDIKLKPEDPYGDYLIFHEIMKHMMNSNVDSIFLTFDNSKGDWMNKNKTPHLHYVQSIYSTTGKILYIVDAERALGGLLSIDIDSLVTNGTDRPFSLITPESLERIAMNSPAFLDSKMVQFEDSFIEELRLNGYMIDAEVERDIKKVEYQILQYRKTHPKLNSIGVMRSGLRIANPNYDVRVSREDGSVSPIPLNRLLEYRKYSEMIEGE